ncbi:BON domain-containing protein [Aliiglaciecola sp. 3_MG-2023]|uniref:BON domain-containing protein n=1 Tax=Aliiglaciecola sp. 3_MG-2023 TaxID=3062644 RepID=UPI0026E28307|nr:BON domain-containing protein [Aliiglaciecola sp. 3_MG-2023]MDO6692830.1 BON domain-containing protein [Aliiglaciecola sp. 3_MG-2023]
MLFSSGRSLILIAMTTLLLQGCAALVVGAGVGAASAAHDRRTLGTQLDDKTATARLAAKFANNAKLDSARIDITVFNGIVLLVGQAPSESIRAEVSSTAQTVDNLRKIHNQMRIAEPIPATVIANDTWLASKVKTALIGDKRVDGLNIIVEVEDSEVFLMGLVDNSEADIAVEIARNVNGVARVIKAFENN